MWIDGLYAPFGAACGGASRLEKALSLPSYDTHYDRCLLC